MDEQSKATLDAILAQEPAALTDADKDFLRARRSYLSEEQKAVYAEVLAEGQEPEKEGYSKMKKGELQAELKAREIPFEDSYKNPILVKMLEQSDAGMVPHIVTKEDLENNPELEAQGAKVGEVIGLPKAE